MSRTIKITATDGSQVEFVDEMKGSGGMKDCYFSPNKDYVVLFFRDEKQNNFQNKDRLDIICNSYRERIFNNIGGEYWKDLFIWPNKVVEYNNKIGIVAPFYPGKFFFQKGSINNDFLGIKNSEKQGKWYASAKNLNRYLAPEEKGDWFKYFQICIKISRAVKRLHAAGLAHSDLSYKNVLIDPTTGSAVIIDNDGLVVPKKFPPDVIGTPDFIAPEVLATKHLPITDKNRVVPNIKTDRHALAVMIYMYLLYRHPLRGGKVHDLDSAKDEELSMGSKALFIEHSLDRSNRVKVDQLHPSQLPQGDPTKIPYNVCGPYLKELFDKAFIEGLHNPDLRPTADEWEQALLKTVDLMQPCLNPKCWHKWYVFDNSTRPKCPFCGTGFQGQLPILNLYYSPKKGVFKPENYRLMVYNKQLLYMWHVNRFVSANELTTAEQKIPVGDFHFHNGKWILINRKLQNMYDKDLDVKINIGEAVELTEGKKILLSTEDGGRLIIVQVVTA